MHFDGITFIGPAIDDAALLDEIPRELVAVLRQTNGLISGRGAFHLRGACSSPTWHSLRAAWRGPESTSARYRSAYESDVPFAQDALGDQYLIRDGVVARLSAESDELEAFAPTLNYFLEGVSDDPVGYLKLGPLAGFWEQGGDLVPGQLLSVYPPLLVAPEKSGYLYRAISVHDRLGALAEFAAQVRDLPDGTQIRIQTSPPAV